ncbi:ribosome maturation factor RimP [Nocardia stercoris]|uniref:Ribosome maturation factor RimP n=1 Tax=Nocardia stercoris TaxID=2483361 RepID=A0A3M2LGD4_9NOCA|nr:ribosome maturation factor RimP [Nocardia stercoris]RMI35673.1 ribosome maturation factor RimP [Nocardia stercoris]
MPMPTEERLSQLIAGYVERRGLDLEGVTLAAAGGVHNRLTVTVDSDAGLDLDLVSDLTTDISHALDEAELFGDQPYLLEVTTPGVDRPLAAPRHWRRAQGRKAKISMRAGAPTPEGAQRFEARIGASTDTEVALVLGGRQRPHRVVVPLADIDKAVVQVEFNPPGAAELELAGGVLPGRPAPGDRSGTENADAAEDTTEDLHDAADYPNDADSSVVAPTEGTVE